MQTESWSTGPASLALLKILAMCCLTNRCCQIFHKLIRLIFAIKSSITFDISRCVPLTFCFITSGKDRTESAQFEYISQFLLGSSRLMVFSPAICCTPPPFTSTSARWFPLRVPGLEKSKGLQKLMGTARPGKFKSTGLKIK